eukprot:TRINITY_DN15389_c0_g1_i2.p1 TRINITY_DN15389_c0_g1~~TRINITY_DN15389_c0_g1_i2.p1  ORF type:complete len:515 (+),score=103.89 TRINITY_DN15389_c0_g1_i2:64-1608(+)
MIAYLRSSSPWPVSTLDLAGALFNISSAELESLRTASTEVYWSYLQPTPSDIIDSERAAQLDNKVASVILFGWHASLLLEIGTTFSRSLRLGADAAVPLELQFCGAYYPRGSLGPLRAAMPEALGCEDVAKTYESWIGGFLDDYAVWSQPETAVASKKDLGRLYRAVAATAPADLHVCVTPLWFCYVLAHAADDHTHRLAPLLLYFDDLGDQVPPGEVARAGTWLRALDTSQGPDAIFAPSALVAALVDRMFGVKPHVVPWICGYVSDIAQWHATSAAQLLVLRADLWLESTVGRAFLHVVHFFLTEGQLPLMLKTMTPPSAGAGAPGFEELWRTAAAEARAAVFVPDDMAKMIFWEACALGIPVWTPSIDHLARMIPFFSYYHFSRKHLPPELERFAADVGRRFPVEPFGLADLGAWERRDSVWYPKGEEAVDATKQQEERFGSPLRALFWAGMSDFVRYPHVQRFGSLPELLAGVLGRCDLGRLGAAMRSAHASRAAAASESWRRAAKRLAS